MTASQSAGSSAAEFQGAHTVPPDRASFWVGWNQSTDDTDPQSAIEYEIYVNGVLSPLAVGAGIDRDFVYATNSGENTFTVKAVDRAGNSSEASEPVTEVLWPC